MPCGSIQISNPSIFVGTFYLPQESTYLVFGNYLFWLAIFVYLACNICLFCLQYLIQFLLYYQTFVFVSLFVLKFLPYNQNLVQRTKCRVLFTFAFHICTFRPVTSVYTKRAMSNTPLSETATICTFFFSNSALAVTRTKTVAVSGDDESKVTDHKLTTPYVTLAYFHQQVDLCCRICVVECVLSCWMEPLFSLEDLLELMSSRCDFCYFFLTPFEKILLRYSHLSLDTSNIRTTAPLLALPSLYNTYFKYYNLIILSNSEMLPKQRIYGLLFTIRICPGILCVNSMFKV